MGDGPEILFCIQCSGKTLRWDYEEFPNGRKFQWCPRCRQKVEVKIKICQLNNY